MKKPYEKPTITVVPLKTDLLNPQILRGSNSRALGKSLAPSRRGAAEEDLDAEDGMNDGLWSNMK